MRTVGRTSVAELEIASIAAGGDGVGRNEGMVVFVPRSAPGDRLRVRVRAKGRFARAEIDEVLRPSAQRVEPPCPHYIFDRCGGCQIQPLSYDAQLSAKRSIVSDVLARIARRSVDIGSVRPSERQWRYRRKLTLAMRRVGGRWIAGLHPYDDPDGVFELRDCPITDERVVAVWREILTAEEWLPRAARLRGSVRLLEQGASFVLEGGQQWNGAEALLRAVPALEAIWWSPDGGRRTLVASRSADHLGGASFVQVNTAVGAALHDLVFERVQAHAPASVVDAYAGSGLTAGRLAAAGIRVTAIELDAEAAALGAARLPAGSRMLHGPVEQMLGGALPADVVILNPPRGGVDARVAAALEAVTPRPAMVLYVSCDPATLARDLTRMPSYSVARAESLDMFPQTAHVETVCELVPGAA